jgi:hypothetical protein
MLCVLFISTRIRLLQLDPLHGNPGKWVRMMYYGCSICFVLHTFLAMLSTYVDLQDQQVDSSGAPVARQYERGSRPISKALEFLKLVLMGLIATGVLIIIYQFFLAPLFAETGRPLAPSLLCIALLTMMYFAVNLAHAMVAAAKRGGGGPPQRPGTGTELELLPVVEVYLRAAKDAVEFCPRFCILFIATLMRAFQLSHGRGAPQAWCQASQVAATGAIVVLAFVRVDVLLSRLTNVCVNLQCLVLCLSCTAGIANVAALLVMTPETACGPGSAVFMSK